jgi:hypothetical protein
LAAATLPAWGIRASLAMPWDPGYLISRVSRARREVECHISLPEVPWPSQLPEDK